MPKVKGKVSTAIANIVQTIQIGETLEVTSQYQRKVACQQIKSRGLQAKLEKLGKEHFRILVCEKKKSKPIPPNENPGFPELTKWTEASVTAATADDQRAVDEPLYAIDRIPPTMPMSQNSPNQNHELYALQKKWQWQDPNQEANKIGAADRRTLKERSETSAATICEVNRKFMSGTPMVQIAEQLDLLVRTVHELLMGKHQHYCHYPAAKKLMQDEGLTDTYHTLVGAKHR
jgi:hypothetical protein